MKKLFLIAILICAFGTLHQSSVQAQENDHLLITEFVVTPTGSEFIEIYNPTLAAIDLSNYYITDATYVSGGEYYYNIVTGAAYGGGTFGDFHARFPNGATIVAGEYQTIALEGDSAFFANYGILPTYEIAEDGAAGQDVPDMLEAVVGSNNGLEGGLTNDDEVIILYYWDGTSDLVIDVDYVLYDNANQVPNEAVDKTGVQIDGPDADTNVSSYLNDTPIANQDFAKTPVAGFSAQRVDLTEGTETKSGGNGIAGHDETGENLSETWTTAAPSPNSPYLTPTHPVTFQCNMDIQIQSGTFDPAADKLVVRGAFNGWAGNEDELTDEDADKIYTITVEMADSLVGETIEYKFVIVPAEGADMWESISNRSFTLLSGGQILDVVYFNDQTAVSVTALVTFQADMSDMLDKGWFDPATDSIRVVGGFNGWANTESMEPDPFDPSLYLYDADITAEAGSQIEWKFRAYPNDQFLDGGWESGSNHVFEFTGEDLILDPLKPNILPGGSPLAQDVTVTFSVDVNHAVDTYNEMPFADIKSVWVTGDWNNWGGSWGVSDTTILIRMYDDGMTNGDLVPGDGVWTTEVIFAAGTISTHLYKFAIYGTGVDTLNGGNAPMDNEAGFAQNHVILIDDTNPTFKQPLDYFGSQYRNYVIFQCNMDIQIQAGNFNPENDMLVVRGSFNGWSGNADWLYDLENDKIYTAGVPLPDSLIGETVEYKHVIIPAAGGDVWESISNRSFILEDGGQVLAVVYFNDVTVLPVTAIVTFQADMSEMLDKGWFDPGTDSIRVVGGFNGWANTESMEPDPFDPSLYVYDASITEAAGVNIEWKFRAYPTDSFLDNGWEAGDNHKFTFTGDDLLLDPLKPNILPSGAPLAQDVTVRFSVDVNDAVDWYNKKPFQDIKSVWVTGDWNNWGGSWSVSDTTVLIRMYDDGITGGDATAGDGIWTADVLFAAGSAATHLYKYSIYAAGVDTLNGGSSPMDNEAGFAQNHVVLISDANPLFVLPTDIFGSQWKTGVAMPGDPAVPTEFALEQNYPNPFNPTTEIAYALPKQLKVNLSIYNSLGQRIATLVDKKQPAGYYNVTWSAKDQYGNAVSSGVYFYRLEAGEFVSTMKMLFIK